MLICTGRHVAYSCNMLTPLLEAVLLGQDICKQLLLSLGMLAFQLLTPRMPPIALRIAQAATPPDQPDA